MPHRMFHKPFHGKTKNTSKRNIELVKQSDVVTHKHTILAKVKRCTEFILTLTVVLLFAMTVIHINFSVNVIKMWQPKETMFFQRCTH